MIEDKSFQVLQTIPKFFDNETKYLRYKLNNPTYSQGDILINTGIMLRALSMMYDRYFVKGFETDIILNTAQIIIKGLLENEAVDGLIPRTIYLGEKEPAESEPSRWERYMHRWVRTDVSKSQLFDLCFGLQGILEYITVDEKLDKSKNVEIVLLCTNTEELLKRILKRLVSDNWDIKNIKGNITKDGRFRSLGKFQIGNNAIRMFALSRLCEKYNIDPKITKFDRFMFKLNMQALSNFHWWQDPDSGHQTLLGYIMLAETGYDCSKYLKEWYLRCPYPDKNNWLFMLCSNNISMIPPLNYLEKFVEEFIDAFNINSGLKYIWKISNANSLEINTSAKEGMEILRTDLIFFNELFQRSKLM